MGLSHIFSNVSSVIWFHRHTFGSCSGRFVFLPFLTHIAVAFYWTCVQLNWAAVRLFVVLLKCASFLSKSILFSETLVEQMIMKQKYNIKYFVISEYSEKF